jgi:hypothetical protein
LDTKAVKANAMAKMLVGHELFPPIPPMAALQEIDIVKSKVFIRYPNLITQMEAKGYLVEEVERTHTRAAIKVTKKDQKPQVFEFTIEDAKMAGLTGSYGSGEKSQYEKRPRVMLWARVVSEAYRATGGRGGTYTPEEKAEVLSEDREDAEKRADILAGQDDALKLRKKEPIAPAAEPVPDAKPEPAEPARAEDPKPATRKKAESKPAAEPASKGIEDTERLAREALRKRQLEVISGIEGADAMSVAKFYLGFYGDKAAVPQTAAELDKTLTLLQEALKFDKGKTLIVKDPTDQGKRIRAISDQPAKPAADTSGSRPAEDKPEPAETKDPLEEVHPNWTGETIALCRAFMKKSGTDEARLGKLLQVFKLNDLSSPEAGKAFVLLLHSSDATTALKLGRSSGKNVDDVFGLVEQKLGSKLGPASDSAAVQAAVLSAMTELQAAV